MLPLFRASDTQNYFQKSDGWNFNFEQFAPPLQWPPHHPQRLLLRLHLDQDHHRHARPLLLIYIHDVDDTEYVDEDGVCLPKLGHPPLAHKQLLVVGAVADVMCAPLYQLPMHSG